jgi:hypothetical protein
MTKSLTAVALVALIASPAKAAAFLLGFEILTPAGAALSHAGALQSVRLEIDPPYTGSVIIECGPRPTQAGLEASRARLGTCGLRTLTPAPSLARGNKHPLPRIWLATAARRGITSGD